jgi:hypothetical protein
MTKNPTPDTHGNVNREEGVDRCLCGCKYWEDDQCVDCGGTQVEGDGPMDDDWIHKAYEAQHPIKPEPYYDGGRLVHD